MQPGIIFLYGLFLATIMLGSLGYHQSINMFAVPVLFFIIIVNILIGSRSALYLLLSSTLLISYYAPNSYMFAFMPGHSRHCSHIQSVAPGNGVVS